MAYLTPREIVEELDRYIIGQDSAKKAVAIALRNRYRRSRVPKDMQDEITPKNIIMAGPTGVGKTEIARRLAKLMNAPFIKVEATKFTEVGYVGRDVDSMVRDLVEASIRIIKEQKLQEVQIQAQNLAQAKLLDILAPLVKKQRKSQNPLEAIFGNQQNETPVPVEDIEKNTTRREEIARQLNEGKLETAIIEIEVEESQNMGLDMMGGMIGEINLGDIFGGMIPKRTKRRKVSVKEARKLLEQDEANKLIDMDEVIRIAIERAEQEGIIFLDEIDKIAGKNMGSGPDVSREGVQRDILPIVEGSTVMTKHGPVKTDYMLFIAAGAFHVAKISDLIPELQGRFPIKVELKPLTKEDFKNILTQPENAIIKQYKALLSTDNIRLEFAEDALDKIAEYAELVNENSENIGARRLHTIIENLLEDISFNASGNHPEMEVVVDAKYVSEHITEDMKARNLQRFIL